MSSGHLVGRRIQPRFTPVVVLSWHGDEELGALVDLSVDRTRADRRPAVSTSEKALTSKHAASQGRLATLSSPQCVR
jgi:hypothetical protein